MLYPIIRRALFSLEAENAHALSLSTLRLAHRIGYRARGIDAPLSLMGLRFPNRVGLAAGFDKNGRYVDALGSLGFGFIEVGTVTPRAQPGQPRPRLFRLERTEALINRMGFPNDGAAIVARRLAKRSFVGICGVNIGKNSDTALDRAVDDYVLCFRELAPHADYVAVNVSSPNTAGLRSLQDAQQLEPILAALQEERGTLRSDQRRIPILVKISPDLSDQEIAEFCGLLMRMRVDGVIATNTTLSRPPGCAVPGIDATGGLSGGPLHARAIRVLGKLRGLLGEQFPIIGVGGIRSAADAMATLQAGAQLVQVYTGLVYRGAGLVREIGAAMAR